MNFTRTYLALAGLALTGASLPTLSPSLVRAAALFESRPLDASRFAVLARPVGSSEWNLLVLEQLVSRPLCWQPRSDGLIDPALNRFDYTGICSRYLDSNGYSLRIGEVDVASSYRLRLQQIGSELQLQAFSPDDPTILLVGRAAVPLRDRDAFVALQLEPGWELRRRSFSGQSLNHVYFSSAISLQQLIARNAGRSEPLAQTAGSGSVQMGSRLSQAIAPMGSMAPLASGSATGSRQQEVTLAQPGRTIALQVIPFRE